MTTPDEPKPNPASEEAAPQPPDATPEQSPTPPAATPEQAAPTADPPWAATARPRQGRPAPGRGATAARARTAIRTPWILGLVVAVAMLISCVIPSGFAGLVIGAAIGDGDGGGHSRSWDDDGRDRWHHDRRDEVRRGEGRGEGPGDGRYRDGYRDGRADRMYPAPPVAPSAAPPPAEPLPVPPTVIPTVTPTG